MKIPNLRYSWHVLPCIVCMFDGGVESCENGHCKVVTSDTLSLFHNINISLWAEYFITTEHGCWLTLESKCDMRKRNRASKASQHCKFILILNNQVSIQVLKCIVSKLVIVVLHCNMLCNKQYCNWHYYLFSNLHLFPFAISSIPNLVCC